MADETMVKPTAETTDEVKTWKRRGLLAAAWAAVAAIVARQTTQPVETADGGPFLIGAANTETTTTTIVNTTSNVSAFEAYGTAGVGGQGLVGYGSWMGVFGSSTGTSSGLNGAGVYGFAHGTDSSGVWGNHTIGIGVLGTTDSGNAGVRGEVPPHSSSNSIAVYGANNSSYAGPSPGAGGFGVYGLSAKGHGLVGATAAAGGAAVVGATNGVVGAYAGAFYGPVIVGGAFTVFGAKSAAVPHPDGSHRLLYCMESPESWFEDFGKGQLECGRADVTIDPDFAAVVDLDDYQVFLTQYGGYDVLSVTEQTSKGFRVETREGVSDSRFGWRVVARRKDIVGERLAKVTIPPEPVLPTEPPMHEAPMPDLRSRMVRQ